MHAIAGFVGLVRDYNKVAGDGSEVKSLTLEHYPGMTNQALKQLSTRQNFAGHYSPPA